MTKSKSKSKSKVKSKGRSKANAGPEQAIPKSTFVLHINHKQFLTKRADEHAAAPREEKAGIVAKATEELLREYSITRKEDISKAKKVVKAWFYDRNDRGETVIPVTKFGFLREMTAQRIWCYEQKLAITETVQTIIPDGPSDPNWIGQFSHQSTLLWKEACKDPEVLERYTEKAERFREGQASLSMKASYGDFCFADFCRTAVNYAWKKFGATVVLMTSRPTHKDNAGSMKDVLVVYDKDPENPHRITFTDAHPQGNWTCNDFVNFAQGSQPSQDGISHRAYVLFHPSGEPMLPEWNSGTPVKQKRDILLHFLRISYVMATGVSSAHPPYKKIIDGDLSDYISTDYRPEMVHDDVFQFRKPGEIKVAHLDAWLTLIQARQEQFLRRETDQIFRFSSIKGEGPVPKPALYNTDFMRNYALEHGPMYSLTPSQLANMPAEPVGGEQSPTTQPTPTEDSNPGLFSDDQTTAVASRPEVPLGPGREQGLVLERDTSADSEELQQHVMFESGDDRGETLGTALYDDNQQSEDDGEDEESSDRDPQSDDDDDDQLVPSEDDQQSKEDDQQVDNYLGFDENGATVGDTGTNDEPGVSSTTSTSHIDQSGTTRQSEENCGMPDKDQEIGGMNMVDELEDSLQELEKPISSMAKVSEPGRDTPRWAGSVRSRRLDFLASLCENKDYQDILVRLRELPYTTAKSTNSLEWSNWNSDAAYLPREVHLERHRTLEFTKYLLSWKKDVATTVSDPHKLEAFLLTVGLAYRDMVMLHTVRDPATVQKTLPEYMNANCSHLTRRIKDVCDTILRTTSEEIKHHTLETSPVIQTKPVARGSRNKSSRKLSQSDWNAARLGGAAVLPKQCSSHKQSTNPPKTQRGEIPIILPSVRPRKRARNESQFVDLDEDSRFIVKRARVHVTQPEPGAIRKSNRGHIPKKISADFEPTVPVMNRRNKG